MLDVSDALRYPGQVYRFEQAVEIEEMQILGDPVRFEGVAVRGEFVGAGERVSIRAHADCTVATRCCRCLEPVTSAHAADIDAIYSRIEDPEDPDLYVFEGSKLDLTDAVRDALLLELPYRFLCKEDCRGLCPDCGTNLNLGSCTCREGQDRVNPFLALKSFAQNNEEV